MSLKERLTSQLAIKLYIIGSSVFIALFVFDAWIMPAVVHSRSEISIPDVRGKRADEAVRLIEAASLTPIIVDTLAHPKIEMNHIVYMNPVPGNVVREGRNVFLTVSGGEERITMPDLIGRSLRDARIALEHMELRIGKISYEASDMPPETVVRQNTPAGRPIRKNTIIEITVSGGENAEIEVPYIIGLSLDDAQRKLLDNGLRPGMIQYRQSKSLLPNTVIGQNPDAGALAAPNASVDITVVH
jgi:eukaryotic-like serine/threonine-protein kinase